MAVKKKWKVSIKYYNPHFLWYVIQNATGVGCEMCQAETRAAINLPVEEGELLLVPLSWLTISRPNWPRCSWETRWLMSAVR